MEFSPSSSLPVSSPSRAFLSSVAAVAAAILVLEIALSRLFGTLLRYHFAFLIISVALCGLGIGGYAMHWLRARKTIDLSRLSAWFGLSVVLSLLVLLRGVFPVAPDAYWMLAVAVLVPFSFGGAWLAEAFALYPQWSGRVYAWDLAGAACAAALSVVVLQLMSAPLAIVFAAILGALPVVLLARKPIEMWPCAALFVFGLVASGTGVLQLDALPPKPDAEGLTLADKGVTQPLFTELGTPGHTSKIVQTRWNAFARTDIVDDPVSPGSYLLYTNGNVPTNMSRWDGELSTIPRITNDFALSDWCFASAPLQRRDSRVFSIGPGGGLDALLALRWGAKRFDGAELNPSILDIMRDYRKYNGGIYQRPEVRVQTADGRAFAREALARGDRYDMVFSALTKTATAGQGMALLESYIYTTDAFTDYWNLLKPDGQMTIVMDNPILLARFTSTWLQVLATLGIDNTKAMQHIAIASDPRPGPYVYALVVQKTPIGAAQAKRLNRGANARRLSAVWVPGEAALSIVGPYPQLGAGTLDLAGFVNQFRTYQPPLDISACPDDRPFVLDISLESLPIFWQIAGFAGAVAIALSLFGLFTSAPKTASNFTDESVHFADPNLAPATEPSDDESAAASTWSEDNTRLNGSDVGWIAYFVLLGIGFMLVEIPLVQKLILPLGYPTLALAVILFSILLGGGIGAWFSQRFERKRLANHAALCALGVATIGALSTSLISLLTGGWPLLSLAARCALTAVLLLPLGFLLGTPFPAGMRLFSRRRAGSVPLVWGLNGVASVVGSLCAAMSGKAFGFSQTLSFGALIYLVAAGVVWSLGRDTVDE